MHEVAQDGLRPPVAVRGAKQLGKAVGGGPFTPDRRQADDAVGVGVRQ